MSVGRYRNDIIKAVMTAQEISVDALAEATGLSTTTVSKIRNGSPDIALKPLTLIADELGVSLATLFKIPEERSGEEIATHVP
jgi:transcriptional regulator with XRE-family HTH domain